MYADLYIDIIIYITVIDIQNRFPISRGFHIMGAKQDYNHYNQLRARNLLAAKPDVDATFYHLGLREIMGTR